MRRFLRRPRCLRFIALLTALLFFQTILVASAQAGFVDVATNRKAQSSQDLRSIQRTLEQKQVRARLQELGFTKTEIQQRLQRLDDNQIHRLSRRLDTLKAGGDAGEVILAVALVFIILWILDHEGYVDIFR